MQAWTIGPWAAVAWIVVVALAVHGCATTEVVSDQLVRAHRAYCGLDEAGRQAAGARYRQALERAGLDGDVSITCPE